MENLKEIEKKSRKGKKFIKDILVRVPSKLKREHFIALSLMLPKQKVTQNIVDAKKKIKNKETGEMENPVIHKYTVNVNHQRRIKRAFNKDGKQGVFRYLYKFIK